MKYALFIGLASGFCLSAAAAPEPRIAPDRQAAQSQHGNQSPQRRGHVIFQEGRLDACQAMAYSFCIELRDKSRETAQTGENAEMFRKFIDPEYLEQHNLSEGDFPIVSAPFEKVIDIRVSDDVETAYCLVENANGAREVFLFRFINDGGERHAMYHFRPAHPPNEETGLFEPWVLRAPVPEK